MVLSIPLSLIITILCFYLLGISMNIISLSGLILGVGMMVDNAIIVVDNISDTSSVHGESLEQKALWERVALRTREVEHALALPTWQLLLVYLVPYLLVGASTLREAAEGIVHGRVFNEDFLMAVATIGALAIGFMPVTEPSVK